jgi:oligopeptidase A
MNPLLSREFLIPFDKVEPDHIERGIKEALERAETDLEAVCAFEGERSYENTIEALDELVERLSRVVSFSYNLNAVMSSPEVRASFNVAVPLFSAFFAKLSTNERLWRAIKAYASSAAAGELSGVRRRHLEKTVMELKRAGADLPEQEKARVEEINVELSKLQTGFAENVLDATNAFELHLTDKADLTGLPESAVRQARASAEAKGLGGYRFTLQVPSYQPFMQYADDRRLRETLYRAFVNRACDGDADNRPLIARILALRSELAALLGYRDFADYALELNMVGSGAAAVRFEAELREKTVPFWEREIELLTDFAGRELGIDRLEPWDLLYVTEKLRQVKYDFDSEELRPYFPVDRVLSGLFEITSRLFAVNVSEREAASVWHPDVQLYDLHDPDGTHLGSFYADWFPRESKQGGAWKQAMITGGPRSGEFEPHLAVIVANFTQPQDGDPALLTHREVQTIFHEFGHLLHHCLSRVEVAARGGTQVARDWVELPSQILENWTWEREALDLFARHYQTGETIPESLYQKMMAARTFMEASAQMRQLSFGSVDLALHIDYRPAGGEDAIAFGQKVMENFVLRPDFAHNHFLTAFSHIFAGGYAAGYYSYKWSEVLDADAFTRFKKEGIFNGQTGREFVDAVLSRGDSEDPAVLFREFMGRDPDVRALLERNLGPSEPTLAGR